MWKSLRYFWRMNLTVIGAVAVTTAVLTGALLVGDSVRGSLRDLTLDRLGKINYALVADRFFHQQLGQESSGTNSAAAILLQGSVTFNQSRASNVQISAVDSAFFSFFDADELTTNMNVTGPFPPVIINHSLARELNAKAGDEILISYSKPAEIHRETILGNRDVTEVVQRNRFKITAVIPNEKIGRFSLNPNQHLPLNAFVPLNRFQRLLRQQGEVNALLFSGNRIPELKSHLRLNDLGLKMVEYNGALSLESDEVILKPQIVKAAQETAQELHLDHFRVLTYLANKISYNGKVLPYSTVTAISSPQPSFLNLQGEAVPPLEDHEILLNEWAGKDLGIQPGENVEMTYYVLGDSNQLTTQTQTFQVKAIIQQTGLAADPNLAPRYPGIEDADDMSDWSPPFPVDLNLIRPQDEEYWDNYRATPKAFVSEKTGIRLWSSRFGTYTSVWFRGRPRVAVSRDLLNRLNPEELNFKIRKIKMEGLDAAEGSTDFGSLFVGFSIFLIVSAVLLVGLLFRLNIDQRKKEIGVLLATGFRIRQLQKRLTIEGGILALLGGIIGTGLAALYAWLMIAALESWWIDAVGTSFLSLHVQQKSLLAGLGISIFICLLTIFLSVRLLSRLPVISLIKGASPVFETSRPSWSIKIAWISVLLSAGFTYYAWNAESSGLFFAGGASFLIACLASFTYWLRAEKSSLRPASRWLTTLRMAVRNGVRNPGRSLLSVSLVASACFVIVAVGASRRSTESDWLKKNSGTGGFSLVAGSSVPIYEDLQDEKVKAELGMNVKDARIFGFRLLQGDDASCLNLFKPDKPRVLGVSPEFINRGGFEFQQTIREVQNPWTLLKDRKDDVVPAIADYNSARWILHKKIGEDITLTNENGKPFRLRLVGLLKSSLLQSELLISEENFVEHFPGQGGRSYFLIEANPQNRKIVLETLESSLSVYGFDAVASEEKLAAYHAVENTYLSTFQTLGALGLLLGTLGLGIILIRNIIERRAELATMRAFGYGRKRLGWFVLIENAFLLIVGISAGSVAAALSILPHVLAQSPEVPWISLSVTLLVVFLVGMTASVAAIASTLRIPLLPALKSENS